MKIGIPVFVKNSHANFKQGVWGDEIVLKEMNRILNANGYESEIIGIDELEEKHYDLVIYSCYFMKNPYFFKQYGDKSILWIQGFNYQNNKIMDLGYLYDCASPHFDLTITSARELAKEKNIPFILPPIDLEYYYEAESKPNKVYDVSLIGNMIKPVETNFNFISPLSGFRYGLFGGDFGKISHQKWLETVWGSSINLHYGFDDGRKWDMVTGSPLFFAAVNEFCMSDKVPWFMETFKDAMAFTDGGDDEKEQIKYYLENVELREKMAARSYEIARNLDFNGILSIVKGV